MMRRHLGRSTRGSNKLWRWLASWLQRRSSMCDFFLLLFFLNNKQHNWNVVGPSQTNQVTCAGSVNSKNRAYLVCVRWGKKVQCLCTAQALTGKQTLLLTLSHTIIFQLNCLDSNLHYVLLWSHQLLYPFQVLTLNYIIGTCLPAWYKNNISVVKTVLTFFPLQLHVFACWVLLVEHNLFGQHTLRICP